MDWIMHYLCRHLTDWLITLLSNFTCVGYRDFQHESGEIKVLVRAL